MEEIIPGTPLVEPHVDLIGDGDYSGAARGEQGTTPPGRITRYAPQNQHFWEIPPVTPAIGELSLAAAVNNKRILYVNGIGTPRVAHACTVKILSIVTGAAVVGIYNQSGDGTDTNIFFDLIQCLGDKTGLNNNPATRTMAKSIYDACVSGVPLNIVAHSQGAIITSRGVRQAIGMLLDHYGRQDPEILPLLLDVENIISNPGLMRQIAGSMPMLGTFVQADTMMRMTRLRGKLNEKIKPRVERNLGNLVSIQTFGGAARFYPDGPNYRHVYNFWDPVPNLFGQGDIFTGPGRGARVEEINRNSGMAIRDFDDHSMDNVYLRASRYYVDRTGRKVDQNYIPIDMSMVRAR